jgi:hypothetical protein
MRHTTRQYFSTLDTETLITIIEGLCGFGGFDVNHGPDPSDGKPIVYGSHHLHGTFTLANVDNAWSIDMDPKKTMTVRIEGDFDKVCDLLSEAVHREINAYEITKMPEDQRSSKVVPKWAETGTARFVCNNLWKPEKNTAIMSLQFDTENNLPPDVQAQELVNSFNDTTHFRVRLESVIPADNGCGCMQDPPCKGCKRDSQPIPKQDVNRLHLFAIYTIGEDLSSSPTVYVMARHDQEAVSIFHKSHSKEHENQACELVVTLVQHCELGDE